MQIKNLKDSIRLVGFDKAGKTVYERLMSLHDYYEELHPVIDKNIFRKEQGIVRLVGTICDAVGEVEKEWENYYAETGVISGGVVRDRHGNVVRKLKV